MAASVSTWAENLNEGAGGPPPAKSAEPVAAALRPLSLKRNFAWTFVGNTLYAASQWVVIVVVAKLADAATVGQYAFAMAVAVPIVVLCELQLRALQVTDAKNEYRFGHYCALRIITMAAALAACGVADWATGTAGLTLLVGLNQMGRSVRELFQSVMQKHERMDYVSTGQVIVGAGTLGGFALVLWLTRSLPAGLAAAVGVRLLVLALYDIPRAGRLLAYGGPTGPAQGFRPAWEAGALLSLTWQAIPLGIVMALLNVETSIPRYWLKAYASETVLGYFAALALFITIGMIVAGALGQSAAPRLSRSYRTNLPDYRTLVARLVVIGMGLGVAGVAVAALMGKLVLRLFYRPEYAEHNEVLVVLMVAGGLSYVSSFLGYALTAARYLKVQVVVNALAVLAVLVSGWWLIPREGLMGAAWSVTIAGAVRLVLLGGLAVLAARGGGTAEPKAA